MIQTTKPNVGDEVRYLGHQWEVVEIEFPETEDETFHLAREVESGYYDQIHIHTSSIETHAVLGWVVKNRTF